jgi:hypothetical protein
VLSSETHHQICQICGDNSMSDGMVRKWVRVLIGGRENMHNDARNGRPSLVIWCIRSTTQCLTTDVLQFLICLCTFLRFQGL